MNFKNIQNSIKSICSKLSEKISYIATDIVKKNTDIVFEKIGLNILETLKIMTSLIKRNAIFVAKKTAKGSKFIGSKVYSTIIKALKYIFASPIKLYNEVKEITLETIEKAGKFAGATHCAKHLSKSFFSFKGGLRTAFNYALPIVTIIFAFSVVTNGVETKYAIAVEYMGENIAYIDDENTAELAQTVMNDRINYENGEVPVVFSPKLSVKKIDVSEKTVNAIELADKVIEKSDLNVVEAYGFYVNGVFKGAVKNADGVQKALDDLLNKFRTNAEGEKVSFVDDISINDGLYIESGIVDEQVLIDMVTSLKTVDAYYTVVSGDAPTSIAEKVGLPYSELKELNPNIETTLLVGQKLLINRSEPLLSVAVTRPESYDQAIPYETIKVNDSSLYKGTSRTLIYGKNGKEHIEASVTYVNGVETSKDIISRVTLSEPSSAKVAIGTKSTSAPQSVIAASGGGFMWPVGGWGGSISSGFGWRTLYGRPNYHEAIDIQSNGQYLPIYASKSGTVTQAGWNGAYGYCVTIDHGNGFTTRYGHLSAVKVSYGQYVDKGDNIGTMGSTGNSSGIHLHFEVMRWGTKYNPIEFVVKPY